MTTKLTITAKGQVTLRKDILEHLGAGPGDKVTVDKMPDGSIAVSVSKRSGKISDVFGILSRPDGPKLTIEEIKEATERAWAGER